MCIYNTAHIIIIIIIIIITIYLLICLEYYLCIMNYICLNTSIGYLFFLTTLCFALLRSFRSSPILITIFDSCIREPGTSNASTDRSTEQSNKPKLKRRRSDENSYDIEMAAAPSGQPWVSRMMKTFSSSNRSSRDASPVAQRDDGEDLTEDDDLALSERDTSLISLLNAASSSSNFPELQQQQQSKRGLLQLYNMNL